MIEIYLTLVVFFIVVCSAFLSFAESSLTNVSLVEIGVDARKNTDDPRLSLLKVIKGDLDDYIAAILIMNVFVNTGGSLLLGVLVADIFEGDWGKTIFGIGFTLGVLYLAEITPKLYAITHSLTVAKKVAVPIYWMQRMISFLVYISVFLTSPLLNRQHSHRLGAASLAPLLDLLAEEGDLTAMEAELVKNAVRLAEKSVEDVMTPVAEGFEYLQQEASLDDCGDAIRAFQHNRILVCDKNMHIIGVVYRSSLFDGLLGDAHSDLLVKDVMGDIVKINTDDKLASVLEDLIGSDGHIAVVYKDDIVVGLLSTDNIIEGLAYGFKF
jgi:CBS domain containing-hemolysin-like protein